MTSSTRHSGGDRIHAPPGSTRASSFGIDPVGRRAPLWTTSEWFNSDRALQLADLLGKIVVLHAFQMLCPACVHHGLPQATRIRETFAAADVAVIGLHTVFEHHAAMTPVSLRAFLHENRIAFPVGVDAPSADPHDPIPVTMRAYGLQGTPSLVLIDRNGNLRRHAFGAEDDLGLGAAIATLIVEDC
jgi:AhpC/TSA family